MSELPVHAYVPGQTARHPEGVFDALRATARDGMSEDALAQSAAFQAGLRYLNSGYFWEAHEVWEPVWLALPEGDARRGVQALIQLANAELKLRMGRPKAALRLTGIVRDLLPGTDNVMGVPRAVVVARIKAVEVQLRDVMHNNA